MPSSYLWQYHQLQHNMLVNQSQRSFGIFDSFFKRKEKKTEKEEVLPDETAAQETSQQASQEEQDQTIIDVEPQEEETESLLDGNFEDIE